MAVPWGVRCQVNFSVCRCTRSTTTSIFACRLPITPVEWTANTVHHKLARFLYRFTRANWPRHFHGKESAMTPFSFPLPPSRQLLSITGGNRDLADSISIAIEGRRSAGLDEPRKRATRPHQHYPWLCLTTQQSAIVGVNPGLSCKGPAGP